MALYLLSYDISEKDHDYQSLWDYLEASGAKRILYSEWAVPWDNNSSAIELVRAAVAHLMDGDRVFACELFNNPTCAWRGMRITSEDFQAMLTEFARTRC